MPSEQIPKADDAHEELNEFYRNHKKTLKHGGDVFVSVFKTGDFGADRETATNEFFDRYSVLHGGLTRLAQAHPFVGGAPHSVSSVGNFN
jgi:hypothetical protein